MRCFPPESPTAPESLPVHARRRSKQPDGFTLVELLAVIAVMALLLAVAGRAVLPSLNQSRNLDKSVTDIAMFLELARSHALANNVNVEVGFHSGSSETVMVAVEAREGESFSVISRVQRLPNVGIQRVNASERPAADFHMGDATVDGIEAFEANGITYENVLRFNSRGEARALLNTISRVIEIGIVLLTPGQTNYGVVQIAGLSGDVAIYRP